MEVGLEIQGAVRTDRGKASVADRDDEWRVARLFGCEFEYGPIGDQSINSNGEVRVGRAVLAFRLAGAEPDVRSIAMNKSKVFREPQQMPIVPSNLEGRNSDERRTGISLVVNGHICSEASGVRKEEAAKALNFDRRRGGLLQRLDDGTPRERPIDGQQ